MDDIEYELDDFERKGFDFYLDWTMDFPIVPERVQLPSGKILDRRELLSDKSDEAKEALSFLELVDFLDVDERCRRYPCSFRDGYDVEDMREKYNSAS